MFYQVVVPPEDRNLLRFFWWPDGDTQRDPEIFRMTVHLFGAVSSPSCSNWALKKTAEDHSDKFEPEIVEMVKKNFYVDDFLVSVPTEERAIEVREQMTELLQLGGFRLTQWMSSSHTVVDTIPTEDRAKGVRDLDLQHDQLPVSRALGVFWDVEQDSFGFRVELKDQPATRRGILSTVSSVYDPIGFLGPYILRAKSLLQELCGSKLDWDDSISEEHHVKWSQWLAELQYLEDLKIPRSYKPKNFRSVTKCDLHMFSDASDVGYCIVAYLVMTDDNFKQQSTFVFAKSRVAPLKKVTVPR